MSLSKVGEAGFELVYGEDTLGVNSLASLININCHNIVSKRGRGGVGRYK